MGRGESRFYFLFSIFDLSFSIICHFNPHKLLFVIDRLLLVRVFY